MSLINFDKQTEAIKAAVKKSGAGQKLLLHCCCAPCFSGCVHRLTDVFDVTAYFYNPNMDGAGEYYKREEELKRLCAALGVKEESETYDPYEFLNAIKGDEDRPEGGARCDICYALRLDKTAEKAAREGYDYFATTLTLSPLKDAARLNAAGEAAALKYGVKYLPSDFKKRGGYQVSIAMSREYGLYRQNYCGCVFSKNKNPL